LWGLHAKEEGAHDNPEKAFKAWRQLINKNKDLEKRKLAPDASLVEFYYAEATLMDLD
jgi:thioesterase domain-containing protein